MLLVLQALVESEPIIAKQFWKKSDYGIWYKEEAFIVQLIHEVIHGI